MCLIIALHSSCGRLEFDPLDDASRRDASLPLCGQLFCADPSFDGDGVVTIDVGGSDNAAFASRGIAERPDGRLVVAGRAPQGGGGTDMLVVGLLTDGSLDPEFGTGGIDVFGPTGAPSAANGLAVRGDGSIVVVGSSAGDGVIARRLPSGGADTSFAGTGFKQFQLGTTQTAFNGVVLYPDGRVAAGGQVQAASDYDFALARVLDNGTNDATFGGTGTVTHDVILDEFGTLASAGPNNTLYIAGQSFGAGFDFDCVVVRLLDDGSLDTSFAGTGVARTSIPGEDRCTDLAVDGSDRVVAGGYIRATPDEAFLLSRWSSNGELDTTFGVAGYARLDAGPIETLYAVTLLPDGRIVAGGKIGTATGDTAMLILLSPDGAPLGAQALGFAEPSHVRSLRIDPQGRVLAMGDITGNGTDIVVARYYVP